MKKEKTIKQQTFENEDYRKIKSLLIMTIIVLAFIGLLFYFNGKFVTKDLFQKDNTKTTEATYDASLLVVDNIFSVSDKEYYVLVFDAKDELTGDIYKSLKASYTNESKKLYSIDLSNQMNNKYYNKDKELSLKNEFNFNEAILLNIKDKKITASYTELNEIIEKLS